MSAKPDKAARIAAAAKRIQDAAVLIAGLDVKRNSLLVTVGIGMSEAAEFLSGKALQKFASKNYPGVSPIVMSGDYKNAGSVARVIGDTGEAGWATLRTFYRYIPDGKRGTDEYEAGAEKVRTLWTEAVKASKSGTPTAEQVKALVAKDQKAGTRGKKAASSKEKTAAKLAAAEKAVEDAGEVTVTLNPAKYEAALGDVSRKVANVSKSTKVDRDIVRLIGLSFVRLTETHGRENVVVALLAGSRK